MSLFFRLVPYFLAFGTIAAAAIDLYQKREEYKNRRLRQTVIVLFIAMAMLTIFGLYHDNAEKEADKQKADTANSTLQAKVDAANRAQTENIALFLKQFKGLSDEVADLKTQVRTEALQKKLDSVQAELLNTQKAMAPAPKATLTFTFFPFSQNVPVSTPIPPITHITLPKQADGSVHVQFEVLNNSEVDALDGQIFLYISNDCKFVREPERFIKIPGTLDNQRLLQFSQISALTTSPTLAADVLPTVDHFQIGILSRCRTCVVTKELSLGFVTVGKVP